MPPKKKSVGAEVLSIKDVQVEITSDLAKQLLGMREARAGEDGVHLEGVDGKVVFTNNDANRPFSTGLAKQYAAQMLRQEWAGQRKSPSKTSNGEPIIIGTRNKIVSGAHRLAGLISAEASRARLELLEAWDDLKELGWRKNEKVTILAPIFSGVDSNAADTVDTGKSRTLSDVLFRRNEFGGKELNASQMKKLSSILAVAVRLVWLRSSGQRVRRGGKLFHPEAIEFLSKHPLLHDVVYFIYMAEGGGGQEGKKISSILSLGYAAGMMYLMAFSGEDRAAIESGDVRLDEKPQRWEQAEAFWTTFAEDMHSKENPIKSLHKVLTKNAISEDKYDRDTVCTLISRAWLAYIGEVEGKWSTARSLTQRLFAKEGDKEILQFVRIGGLDVDHDNLIEMGIIKDEAPRRTSSGDWKVGDTCWVNQLDSEGNVELSWFGEITEISDDGETFRVLSNDDNEIYPAEKSWISNTQAEVDTDEYGEEDVEEDDDIPF